MAIRGGFEIATAYVDLILDKDHAKQGVRELPKDLNPHADKAGRDTGNVISRGIRLSIVRNSPLIAAAIAGGIMAGAPLLLGAATLIMGGVAAIAAAQSNKVRSAWVGAWDNIKRGAIEDARVLVPTFVGAAGSISQAFERMRPTLRDAFGDLAPQLDVLVGAVGRFVVSFTNGLVVAIKNGQPVIQGMAHFIEELGSGFEDAMTRMSQHSQAAGQVWAQLGDILGTLLALFGDLMGTGAELAAVVLPALSGSLKVLLAVADLLGPLLPIIGTGFVAFKMAQTASKWVDSLTTSIRNMGSAVGGVEGGTAKATGAMGRLRSGAEGVVNAMGGKLNVALAAGAVLLMEWTAVTQKASAMQDQWVQALLKGGDAADQARAQYQELRDSEPFEWMADLDEWSGAHASLEEAEKAAQDYLASLTPLGRAQHEVQVAQDALNVALDEFGPGSSAAVAAQHDLDRATAEVTRQLELEEAQLNGVTKAMIEMADQAAARANSDIAYRQSLIATDEALAALTETQKDSKATTADITKAGLDFESALIRQAEAAGKLASDALPATVSEQEKAAFAARRSLEELDALKNKYGELPPSLETYRLSLERIAGGMDATKLNSNALIAGLEGLGMTVTQIPDTKDIRITAPTQEVVDKLGELGFTITEIPGTKDVLVSADTDEAKANVGNIQALLMGLDGTEAHPLVTADDRASGAIDQIFGDLFNLDGTAVSPDATLDTTIPEQAQGDIDWLQGLGEVHAEPSAEVATTIPGQTQTDMDALDLLGAQTAVPAADLDDDLFGSGFTSVMTRLATVAAQRPTPVAGLTDTPVRTAYTAIMGMLGSIGVQRPTPTAAVNDQASGILGSIRRAIDGLYSKTVTVTTIYRSQGQTVAVGPGGVQGGSTRGATGGVIGGLATYGFAAGGSPGGKVFGPGTSTSDSVGPWMTERGIPAFLSNLEWIIRARSSQSYGDKRMKAVNDGLATILLPEEADRLLGGGRRPSMGLALGGAPDPVRVTPTPGGATVSIGQLHVHIKGIFDLTKPMEMRRLGQELRKVLIQLDREHA